jgi:predicted transcriptional regulator of viral defense system
MLYITNMSDPKTTVLLDIARKRGTLRPRDLDALGIPREYLWRYHQQGILDRRGRGLYSFPDAEVTEYHTLAQASKRTPKGVVCLLSALSFHKTTTQLPLEVWLAIDRKARRPKSDYPLLHIVRFSGIALTSGVEEHQIEGITVKVYCLAKTIADCFKYRNKIGFDVALEALRETWRARRVTMEDLWRYGKICRVANVMRPYLESLV